MTEFLEYAASHPWTAQDPPLVMGAATGIEYRDFGESYGNRGAPYK